MKELSREKVTDKTELKAKEIELNKNAITGGKHHLYNHLKISFSSAYKIDIIVSFLMESGVKLLMEDLKSAISRGVTIRILTGSYLNITQPSALYLLKKEFKDLIDLRFYNIPNKSFHPKAYIFKGNKNEIYVGSSNISRGALTNSIEWNYRFYEEEHPDDYKEYCDVFEDLFINHSIIIDDEVMENYSKNWVRPKVFKDIEKIKEEDGVSLLFEPRGAQVEALYKLQETRDEGFDKALVVAATGIGKTYLAAFDSKKYKRVLFVAHREEIINQAAQSFKNVRNNEEVGFFYNNTKDTDKNIVFALVQTLGKEKYLNEEFFSKDYFDYIIIDEFHHAVSNNYRNIIEYFTPKFLLGITATPERLDSKDVFALCDYNLVYEIRLAEAINKGFLVPFRYYGIYDETVDYSKIDFINGKYKEDELEKALMLNERANLIYNHYSKYNSKRAMGFCSSRKHAEYMAKYFTNMGVPSVAVYSGETGEYSLNREEALSKLSKGEIKVLFSVDMFNEGLDIPNIDMVMFLRPTESSTIFLQQLGRGLRKAKDKEYLIVLDFIGNYKKADMIPFLLSGKEYSRSVSKNTKPNDHKFPDECIIDFDFKVVDIFKKMAASKLNIQEKVREEYYRVKELLSHSPSRVEFFNNIDEDIYDGVKVKSKINPFNNYLGFLKEINELSVSQEKIYNSNALDLINLIETTSMSKSYKMPIFLAFYNHGDIKMNLTEDDIYNSFYEFYHKGSNKVDMLKDKGTKDFEKWSKEKYIKLAKYNPIKYLMKTSSEFFCSNEETLIGLNEKFESAIGIDGFAEEMKDAICYRVDRYYREREFK